MIVYERKVRFEEVDAARILFFARFLNIAHEAMEHFFDGLEGGYSALITKREIGLPAVDVHMSFKSPVRYGDTLAVRTSAARIGKRSAVVRYELMNAEDSRLCAEVLHTVVSTNLVTLSSIDLPSDIRAILEQHLELREPSP